MESGKTKYERIMCPNVIVCEGLDAKNYLIWLLEALKSEDARFDHFHVFNAGGVGELPRFVKALPNLPNYSIVNTLTIGRDAEGDAKGAGESVKRLLRNTNFASPDAPCKPCRPKGSENSVITGYALFPSFESDTVDGTLEDLCLETLAGKNAPEILDVADRALARVEEKFGKFKRRHKNRLHTYLSLTDEFVTGKLGESAKWGAYDSGHPKLNPLKEFLCSMADAAHSTP
ncbi:MAG: hypothetical protein LBM17_03595 [Candidatus Accumulibacter sp.]|jgi:hypothetical protein|nr:hypothetical protein [Accumulibacter sp.]